MAEANAVNDLVQTVKSTLFEYDVKVQRNERESREIHRNSKDSVVSAAGES